MSCSSPSAGWRWTANEVIAAAHAEARKSITARMWVYRGITVPINAFDLTVSRHRDGPEIFFLQGFTGKLMADCYSGYDAVQTASDGRIVRAACAVHARRKVFKARCSCDVNTRGTTCADLDGG